MLYRSLLLTTVSLGAAIPALADLKLTVGTSTPPAPKPKVAKPAATRRPASDLPPPTALKPRRQVGVVRRGSVPVLPSADGTMVPEFPEPAPAAPKAPPVLLPVAARLGRMIAPATDVHRLPDARSPWVSKLKQGTQVAIVSQWQGWFAVIMGDGSQAYVPQTHVEVLPYEVKSVGPARPDPAAQPAQSAPMAPSITPGIGPQSSNAELVQLATDEVGRKVVEEALTYRGTPYVYGGNSRGGVDCSGLVKNCYATTGVQLPRRASEQARVGQEVPMEGLRAGDRIYFSVRKQHDHTGIYLGNGYFIHAARGLGRVDIDHLSAKLYARSYSTARRL